MLNQNEKLERFAAQVNRTAEKSVQKIQKQTEKISDTQVQTFCREAEDALEERKHYAKERLQREANHAVAAFAAEKKRQASSHREEIVDGVFQKAREKIAAFTETPAYRPLLESCIRALLQSFKRDHAVLFVRRQDIADAEEIVSGIDQTVLVAADEENTLGLARVESDDGSVCLSDTFQSRLAAARAGFLGVCGLSVMPEGGAV